MLLAARPYYVRLQMDGFLGEKDVVLIPDDLVLDSKSMGYIMRCLKMNPPNFLIEGVGSSVHPSNMLNDSEIALLAAQNILGEQADSPEEKEVESQMIREVMVNKLNAITRAILQGIQETGSAFFAFSTWMITFDILSSPALRALGGSVQGIGTFHANDQTVSDPRTIQMIKDLLEGSVPLDATTKDSKQEVVHLNGRWLFDGMNQPWEGHSCLTTDGASLLADGKRKSTSQWCNPMAQTFLIFFARKPNTENCWDETLKAGMGFDPLRQRDLVAPPGMIFIGGCSQSVKDSYNQCFANAVPALIIKFTGGISNIYAELVESLHKIISGDATEFSLVVEREVQHDVQDVARFKRLGMVCPQRLLTKAYKNSAQDRYAAVRVTIDDVVTLLDLAKARPQMFLHTIKVFDPVVQSPSQALNILSECISNTYVGLSMDASSDDILHKALRMRQAFATSSHRFQCLNSVLVYATAILTWLSLFTASFHVSFDSCKANLKAPNASVGWFCKDYQSRLPDIFSTLVVVLPITYGFVTTLMSHFSYQQKWAKAKMAAEEIESHIFRFRTSTGPYAKRGALQNEESEDEPSNLKVDSLVRHRFSSNVQKIALATDLRMRKDDVDLDLAEAVPVVERAWTTPLTRFWSGSGSPVSVKQRSLSSPILQTNKSQGSVKQGSLSLPLLQKSKSQDDGVSPLTSDEYYDFRFQSLKDSYLSAAPTLSKAQNQVTLMILAGGLVASLLGAYSRYMWIPVVLGFTTMLQNLVMDGNVGEELASVNRSLSALQSMSVQWKGLSRIDRRAPRFKEEIVALTEHAHMAVVQTQTGIGMLLDSDSEDLEETEQDDWKAKTSKTTDAPGRLPDRTRPVWKIGSSSGLVSEQRRPQQDHLATRDDAIASRETEQDEQMAKTSKMTDAPVRLPDRTLPECKDDLSSDPASEQRRPQLNHLATRLDGIESCLKSCDARITKLEQLTGRSSAIQEAGGATPMRDKWEPAEADVSESLFLSS